MLEYVRRTRIERVGTRPLFPAASSNGLFPNKTTVEEENILADEATVAHSLVTVRTSQFFFSHFSQPKNLGQYYFDFNGYLKLLFNRECFLK